MAKSKAITKRSSDALVPRDAVLESVSSLQALADQHHAAAKSLSRLALRLASEERPMSVTPAFELYIKSDLPDVDAVEDILGQLEGTQSPDWQARRAKTRENTKRTKLRWHFDCGRDAGPVPEWAWDPIMAAARERRDVLSAAVSCCEQGVDGKNELAIALGQYLKGDRTICCVRDAMEQLGLGVEGAKVVALVPRRRGVKNRGF